MSPPPQNNDSPLVQFAQIFSDLLSLQSSPDEPDAKVNLRHGIGALLGLIAVSVTVGMVNGSEAKNIAVIAVVLVLLWFLISRIFKFTDWESHSLFHVNLAIFWVGIAYFSQLAVLTLLPDIHHSPRHHFLFSVGLVVVLLCAKFFLSKGALSKRLVFLISMLVIILIFDWRVILAPMQP